MNILVTGGAGYIGSVAVQSLLEKGHFVVVVDNLSKGIKRLVPDSINFYERDIKDDLSDIFEKHSIDCVMHFAAYKAVGESMQDAVKYSDNITGIINVLNTMVQHDVKRIIFSSSAAVYGMPEEGVITEDSTTKPINFYGFTKLEMEHLINWYSQIHGLTYVALRYFNVAGDAGLKYVDPEAQNIFPIILEVMTGKRDKLTIFGNDYDTPDGTCIRDYIHIQDLVDAHVLAVDSDYSGILNLGTSNGCSVKELVETFESVSGEKIVWGYGSRRAGDPAKLVAVSARAKKVLGWEAKRSLHDMVQSTIDAYQ